MTWLRLLSPLPCGRYCARLSGPAALFRALVPSPASLDASLGCGPPVGRAQPRRGRKTGRLIADANERNRWLDKSLIFHRAGNRFWPGTRGKQPSSARDEGLRRATRLSSAATPRPLWAPPWRTSPRGHAGGPAPRIVLDLGSEEPRPDVAAGRMHFKWMSEV